VINGGRGPNRCYKCNEKGHLSRDRPHPRRPWCSHFINNGHATEDFPKLITKWEDRVHQHEANLIILELKREIKGQLPNINIITRGGVNTRADVGDQSKIQKAIPKDVRYDPVKQKLFLKNSIEIFKRIPIPRSICHPNPAQAPTSPPTPKNSTILRKHPD
jgi:hypothetical protein